VVDTTAPSVAFTEQWAAADGRVVQPMRPPLVLEGTSNDDQGVSGVTVCTAGRCEPAVLHTSDGDPAARAVTWSVQPSVGPHLDAVATTFEVFATDYAGNRSATPTRLTLRIDNVPPKLDSPAVDAQAAVATGHVTDGSGSVALTAIYTDPSGAERTEGVLVAADGSWRLGLPPGRYRLMLLAVDTAGNRTRTAPVDVSVRPWQIFLPTVAR
jgi:hypothetical protein